MVEAQDTDCSCCAAVAATQSTDVAFRHILWIVLAVNAAMFGAEAVAGVIAGSVSLQADALDFLGDAANYGIALFALSRPPAWRAGSAFVKGAAMAAFGVWVLAYSAYNAFVLDLPSATIMGTVGFVALLANLSCAALLFRFRAGDANRRAVWICSRNDVLGNLAVLVAASGVAFSGTPWPDLAVGAAMGVLALSGAATVLRQSAAEFRVATVAG
ncbi:MAG TPA: cation transporter [Propylenella sp.]